MVFFPRPRAFLLSAWCFLLPLLFRKDFPRRLATRNSPYECPTCVKKLSDHPKLSTTTKNPERRPPSLFAYVHSLDLLQQAHLLQSNARVLDLLFRRVRYDNLIPKVISSALFVHAFCGQDKNQVLACKRYEGRIYEFSKKRFPLQVGFFPI